MEEEIYLPEDINETLNEVELTKPRKKKVYTKPKTQKQLENFNKAKSIRYEQIKQKKLEDQKQLIQQVLDTEKKIKKSMKQQEVKPEVKITEYDNNKSSSESSEEEIIIKSKPKTKPKKSKKKTVIYLSETESESEPEPIKKPKSRIQRNNINQVEPEQKNIIKPIEYKTFLFD